MVKDVMPPWSTLLEAESALLARRRGQHGLPTLGDDADRTLVAALAALPAEADVMARESGLRVGTHVFSRRFSEDTLVGSVALLSATFLECGLGTLRLESSFHRTASVRFTPAVRDADARAVGAFAEGAIEGFLSVAFNCVARVSRSPDGSFRVELGEGKDVNRGRGRA